MMVLSKVAAPRYRRQEGITSYLLASPRTCAAKHLTTSLVQLEPGGEQKVHHHAPEQVYFILEGSGLMTVGNDTHEVHPGDCIFIPSDAPHGLKNQAPEPLRYFTAAAPAFEVADLLSLWDLGSERDEAGNQE